jgi:hypothetical protein
MPTPIVFQDVAPVVPVRDLQAALERYRQLGFDVRAYGRGQKKRFLAGRRFLSGWERGARDYGAHAGPSRHPGSIRIENLCIGIVWVPSIYETSTARAQ